MSSGWGAGKENGERSTFCPALLEPVKSAQYRGQKVSDKMRVGYARVSADDQNLDRQRAALASATCDELVEEVESGVKARNRLGSLLARLAPGDELVVKSLDRLGRRAGELVILLDEQHRRGVNVRILDMPWLDYSAPKAGRTVRWEAVERWLQSWGTREPLRPPQVGD